jgi:hypothetical protein
MNWYKQAQSLGHYMELRQLPDVFISETALPETQKAIEKLKLQKALDILASQSTYKSTMDYLLCLFFPHAKKACDNYYNGEGKRLIESMDKEHVRKMDLALALSLYRNHSKIREQL